jgi:hypothetical protein
MEITSNIRAPRAQVMIGGQSFGVLSATVNQEATRRSSTMSASCALNSFPGGDAFFAGQSDNKGRRRVIRGLNLSCLSSVIVIKWKNAPKSGRSLKGDTVVS